MKTHIQKLIYVSLFALLIMTYSCKETTNDEKNETVEKEEPQVEKSVTKVENKVMHDNKNVKKARVENMHNTRFIELFFAYKGSEEEGVLAECYNTMFTSNGIPESKNTAPQELVEGLDFKKMAEEYGVFNVSLNGPKIWLPDWTDIDEGTQRTFNGLEARWVATLQMGNNTKGVKESVPYKTVEIKRNSSLGWNKGTEVLLMDDAEGNTYVLKGFQLGLNPKYTYEEFMSQATTIYKNLPEGWKIRIKTLDKDLIETPKGGVATIMPDEFFNIWDDAGMMNYKP